MLAVRVLPHIGTTKYLRIRERAPEDRPREKLVAKGASYLSTAELLGILIGSGVPNMSSVDLAQHILQVHQQDIGLLLRQSVKDFQKFNGIGEAKAAVLVSALELIRRFSGKTQPKAKPIRHPKEAYELMKPELTGKITEEFWVLLLTANNTLIRKCQVSMGGFTRTTVDPKVIFKYALEYAASKLILVHNHPSNNLKPSQADIKITQKLLKAVYYLDLEITDHIIFTDGGYYSFSHEGILASC